MTVNRYERDLRGYGRKAPDPKWPDNARLAVQFVVNYEEGGENCLLHGDSASEAFLSEIVGAEPWHNRRHWNMESIYEYGPRVGFWRLHRIFNQAGIPVTVYGVATALARSPEQVAAMLEAEWEIASHGLKWIEYGDFPKELEKEHMLEAIRLHTEVVGNRPRGWYTGRCSVNTVGLAAEVGGFDYVADSYADELPYWEFIAGKPQLVVPYTLDANDMRFSTAQGFNTGQDFFRYLRDSFRMLYKEGKYGRPAMLSIGLHCRLAGRPGRAAAVRKFVDYLRKFDDIWITRRIDIARHWKRVHPPDVAALRPSTMDKSTFVESFGGVFEISPWIAERAFQLELGRAHDCAAGVHNALCRVFRSASKDERLVVLKNHPDLAGKLTRSTQLTDSSRTEQSSVGLLDLKESKRTRFLSLNDRYRQKNGFPFIVAVKDHSRKTILEQFENRLGNSCEVEFEEACRQVERIAWHRLKGIFEGGD